MLLLLVLVSAQTRCQLRRAAGTRYPHTGPPLLRTEELQTRCARRTRRGELARRWAITEKAARHGITPLNFYAHCSGFSLVLEWFF